MKVELSENEMQHIRSVLRGFPMGSVEYVIFERLTSILLGDD